MNIWNDLKLLERLENQRAIKRQSSIRLTFDCLNLKHRGDRAFCSKGIMLGQAKDGSLSLLAVLKGVISSSCKECKYFVSDED